MLRWTFLIFLLLILSGCIGSQQLGTPCINPDPSEPLVNSIGECINLSEDSCGANVNCQPVYGPSSCVPSEPSDTCSSWSCTKDLKFKGCGSFNASTFDLFIAENKPSCELTGGQYLVDSFRKTAECVCPEGFWYTHKSPEYKYMCYPQ